MASMATPIRTLPRQNRSVRVKVAADDLRRWRDYARRERLTLSEAIRRSMATAAGDVGP
jgi:hypothetical protein